MLFSVDEMSKATYGWIFQKYISIDHVTCDIKVNSVLSMKYQVIDLHN